MSTTTTRTRRPLRLRAPLPAWGSVVAALVGAGLMTLSFQPFDAWPLVVPGVALALVALRGRRTSAAFGIGALTGAAFFAVHIQWITVYLGPLPLVGLTGIMALWWGLGGMLLALAWRLGERMRGAWAGVIVLPALLAGLWMLRESLSSTVPWGGFSWGRLAYSQASSPVGDAVSWVGASGLTFLLAFVAAVLAVLVLARGMLVRRRLVVAAAVVVGLVAIPAFPVAETGTVRVGAVQGDSEAGLLAEYRAGDIIRQHAEASELLAGEQMDVLVWPENAGETDPQDSLDSTRIIDDVQALVDAPIVLGAVTHEGADTYNSLLLWDEGVRAVYHKRHPVPFAEYLPERDFFGPLLDALGFLDLIPRDYSLDPTSENAFDVDGVVYGLAICFDIIDDGLVREMVAEHGAQIILAPTNNADFGEGSWENVQQLAIAQLRAQEAGRALVNISTVGTSAMMLPDGTMVDRLPQYEPGAMIETLPLSDTVTPAMAGGALVERAIAIASIGLLLGLALVRRRRA
ncbi:apolipoprotein N-acyltransferase [Agrococcus sp. SGAir0287]|uniref:apolipoprotein N-acyltransferase n=1 Tax=Agrococcus sp. SGAir0287 TaxID=2070347 RepID=UPI0010CCEF5E|nr:apolipoprotein N-acyltransferase [Agrococcus sp. SGAir0287]QCR19211.1 apolipoprotein N-acyltransferase [Agrococcus sp. SGAir0287]